MNDSTAHRARPDGLIIQTIVRLEEYHAIFTEREQCDSSDSLLCVIGEKIGNAGVCGVAVATKTSSLNERKMKA